MSERRHFEEVREYDRVDCATDYYDVNDEKP
jgi:hypothetical protein